VKARTRVVVGSGGALTELSCQPPLTVRRIRTDAPDTCALCLVGTAAGPLPGDELSLELQVDAGARATLQASGASLAQGTGPPSRLTITVALGPGASLTADPGPLIVGSGARVDVALRLELATDARLSWRETVVLGRTNESPGAATVRWDVIRADRPILRQLNDLSDPPRAGGYRVLANQLIVGGAPGSTVVHSPTAVLQVLADGSRLATVLANDAATVAGQLDRLVAASDQLQASPAGDASSASTLPSMSP
jgi:urease accessory protein